MDSEQKKDLATIGLVGLSLVTVPVVAPLILLGRAMAAYNTEYAKDDC